MYLPLRRLYFWTHRYGLVERLLLDAWYLIRIWLAFLRNDDPQGQIGHQSRQSSRNQEYHEKQPEPEHTDSIKLTQAAAYTRDESSLTSQFGFPVHSNKSPLDQYAVKLPLSL